MKLLFGANISRRIVPTIDDLFPASSHMMLLSLSGETPDVVIWSFAMENAYTLVTADADFVNLSIRFGAPPKVIRLERMGYSTAIAASLIRRLAVAIADLKRTRKRF